ncbi:ER degradation-enhancing alpha-mannosidase-like protein 3 isoform X3 [Ctenocephalides felis]|uniref:ER degradation-enhancing alpha-mannosidase-like protein 3 isoform X3 n=1 Tax=Ctenocephalides felis TaxID=7515 RepID=UPI000E6E57B6|nr:ER degradation-enhancing alpha-mannosidase-like protein 3 isoform X3 [Ctenocephalides felis]XP_026468093.1 ER degradation-enhancing alpha-mannosidase-like protein 3 isoform X3 [Ctenocephalides felis]
MAIFFTICGPQIQFLLTLGCFIVCVFFTRGEDDIRTSNIMSKKERDDLKEESREMFYHAYRAYMDNAYPADELMPLSCAGRYRGIAAPRGDMDDILGNFSLTLVDTLDSLVILGDFEEFEHAVKLVINDVSFDNDIIVSVFETNIRMLGGLLSAHVLAEYLQQRYDIMLWYRGELLHMAKDLGYRLLPAFNTTTGIPHARVNLRHGIKGERLEKARETCTACAGTMILEMAALSRLSGEPIFEMKAHHAMDELWKMRHRSSDLMGTVLNVHSGDWIRKDSGVGAGIDSYYEYCLKAYILLGEDKYLNRFNRHYSAVMKYISQGPMLLDVHMHRPHTNSRNFMDALLAFWPGLQVLTGDLKPAVETHEMLYQVMQRHTLIPEAFTLDFQVHWAQHPLRPEFLESTYFLYRATQDPYYLQVGKKVLRALQVHAKVPCGYAAVNDVRTGMHEDRMDSFVLAETFKYLFLLFSDPSDLVLDLDEFIFTTEAHLLPLTLAGSVNNSTILGASDLDEDILDTEFSRTCPTTRKLFPESVRKPLQDLVSGVCVKTSQPGSRKLKAADFQTNNPEHLKIVRDMGISMLTLNDGRARSPADAEEGLIFMQEMVELSKTQSLNNDVVPQSVVFWTKNSKEIPQKVVLLAGPSHFGRKLEGDDKVFGKVVFTEPLRVCSEILNSKDLKGRIAIMERGDCIFVDKARKVEAAGAIAAIVVDNVPSTSSTFSPMFIMSGDGTDDVHIPVVFLFTADANVLKIAMQKDPNLEVVLGVAQMMKNQSNEAPNIFDETQTEKNNLLGEKVNESRSIGDKHGSIALKYFTASFVTVNGKVKVVIEYTGPSKTTDLKSEQNNDDTKNLFAPFVWNKKRKEILNRVFSGKLELPEELVLYYFNIVNEQRGPDFKSRLMVGLRWMTHWLLNELEIERDPTSIYAIPSDLIVEVSKSDIKNKLAATQKLFDEILRFKDKSLIELLERMDKIESLVKPKPASVDSDEIVSSDRTISNKKDEL